MKKIMIAGIAAMVLASGAMADVKNTIGALKAELAGDYPKAEAMYLLSCGAKKVSADSMIFSRKLELVDVPAIFELANGVGDGDQKIFNMTLALQNVHRIDRDVFSKISTQAELESAFSKFKKIYGLEALTKAGYKNPGDVAMLIHNSFVTMLSFLANEYLKDNNAEKAELYFAAACQFAIDDFVSYNGAVVCHDAAVAIARNSQDNNAMAWAVVRGYYMDKLFNGNASESNRKFMKIVKADPATLPAAINTEDTLKKLSFGKKNIFLPLIEENK